MSGAGPSPSTKQDVLLPPRRTDGHKGTFGTVVVLGGQLDEERMMVGAPALTALAALRCGAGRAMLASTRPVLAAALTVVPEATGLALPADRSGGLDPSGVAARLDREVTGRRCLAVGPGWGCGSAQERILARLLCGEDPIVVDADALNIMAGMTELTGRDISAPVVLTPHPGEFRRLAEALGVRPVAPENDAERREGAECLARKLGCVVVLKGPGSVITDGHDTTLNTTGNAALATAGTGDVLTGVIAGFIAQFYPQELALRECAVAAVLIHGRSAEAWARDHGPAGMLARELADGVPAVVESIRRG